MNNKNGGKTMEEERIFKFGFKGIIRFILDWLVVFAVIFFGSKIIPSRIKMETWQAAVVVSLVMTLLGMVVGVLFYYLVKVVATKMRNNSTALAIILVVSLLFLFLFLNPLVLYFSIILCEGVMIYGFWTYFLIGVIITILSIGIS